MKYKKIIIIIIFLVLAAVIILVLRKKDEYAWICEDGKWIKHGNPSEPMPTEKCGEGFCAADVKVCPDGSYVSRIPPECNFAFCQDEESCDGKSCSVDEGIIISEPELNKKLESPLNIKGEAQGSWFFEAEFRAELFDDKDNLLGRAILRAEKDWMTEDLVPFAGELVFSNPSTTYGKIKFSSANPSGLAENQKIFEIPIRFKEVLTRKILLYYYNSERDKDEEGNIKCSRDGLMAVEREIPLTKSPIKDTINKLLSGELTEEERANGISTEYPLEELFLKDAPLDKAVLTLEFDDPNNKTVGGACRVGILWFQIEATAKQFPEVKEVRLLPNDIFQP